MRSIKTTSLIVSLLALAVIAGCSRRGEPTTPEPSARVAERFSNSGVVFPPPFDPNVFKDLDLAALVQGYVSGSLANGICAVLRWEGADHGFTIEVSIAQDGQVPWLAWMIDGNPDFAPRIVDRRPFGIPGGDFVQYKFPKVDAIYRQGATQDESDVNVAVSFMWRLV